MNIKARLLLFLVLLGVVFSLEASAPEDNLVARVGERVITNPMLDDAVNQALNASYYHRQMTAERRQTLEQEQLQELIQRELNILGALDRGLGLPEAAAEKARVEIVGRLGKEAYAAILKDAGMTPKDHTRAIAETLLARLAYGKFVLEPAQVGDEEIRAAFNASPDHWRMPESVHVLHILLKVLAETDEDGIELIREQMDFLVDKLAKGEDFGTLAAEYSQDMYRIKGGDLGWVHRGRLVTELEEALWNLDVGEIVGPVRSREGFHLAKILGQRPPRLMEYPEVEPLLREQLEKQKLETAKSTWFDALRKTYPVIILDLRLGEEN